MPAIYAQPASWAFGFRGYGMGQDELARVRAERAQVQAEIQRLQAGGRPLVGGFQPVPPRPVGPAQGAIAAAASAAEARAALSARDRRTKLLVGGALLAAAVAAFAYGRRRKS